MSACNGSIYGAHANDLSAPSHPPRRLATGYAEPLRDDRGRRVLELPRRGCHRDGDGHAARLQRRAADGKAVGWFWCRCWPLWSFFCHCRLVNDSPSPIGSAKFVSCVHHGRHVLAVGGLGRHWIVALLSIFGSASRTRHGFKACISPNGDCAMAACASRMPSTSRQQVVRSARMRLIAIVGHEPLSWGVSL